MKEENIKGITLVALVITIVILLILAGISINAILQNGGIIENTQKTSELTQIAAIKEAVNMKLMGLQESGSKITTEELEDIVKNSNAEVVKNEVGNITDIKIGKKLIKIEEIIPDLDIEKTNESLIGIVKNATKSEIRNISVKSEKYSANILVYKGDLILDGIKQVEGAELKQNKYEFGNKEKDVGTESEDAKNMVILKIDGDLTVNSGITLTACKSDNGYGGPKGMLIYCTGTLTNNGTISMTARGAKAEGQDVYLWKNSDNSYEFVPAVGASGASRAIISASGFWGGRFSTAGISGNNSINRQTAGGGSGAAICHGDSGRYTSISGAGTNGTSYSGGTGGGAALGDINYSNYTAEAGTINGGKGGKSKSNYLGNAGSGAGNPGGTDGNVGSKGSNGTGGLLIIYANNIINNSIIESNGSNGGTGYWNAGGGSSGGGSINIFYKDNYTENNSSITADGGIAMCATGYKGGAGGTGSISLGQILNGTYTSTYTNY